MKKSLKVNNAWLMFFAIFFLSAITIIFIAEFRFFKEIVTGYEESIRQVAANKTSFFLDDLRAVTERAAGKLQGQGQNRDAALKEVLTLDHRITGAYILDSRGRVMVQPADAHPVEYLFPDWAREEMPLRETRVLGVHANNNAQTVVTVVTPLKNESLAVDYSITDFQQELTQEFLGNTCKVAVFDSQNYPVVWPFERKDLDKFTGREVKFFTSGFQYNVSSVKVGHTPWKLYFFLQENNFDTYRIITVMFLLFALYCCLYQLLVELWRVNSADSYFENIDFNILNYVNEGVIISNNAGRVIFANKPAHEIFPLKKGPLKGAKLEEILGHIGDARNEQDKYGTLTLKTADRLLQVIHSPIIKKGKVLGALTVVGVSSKVEEVCSMALSRLMEALPQGALYLDRNHKVVHASLMARYYLGILDLGVSIDAVDPELASFIYRNIGSRSVKAVRLSSRNLFCEIIFINDGDIHAGTLVLINEPEMNSQKPGEKDA